MMVQQFSILKINNREYKYLRKNLANFAVKHIHYVKWGIAAILKTNLTVLAISQIRAI